MTVDDESLRTALSYEKVAVVGCSRTPGKAAHDIPAYLQGHGYQIHPVNPFAGEILDQPAVDDLGSLPEGAVEIVNVFRPSDEVSDIVDEALPRDDIRVLWTQLGIRDDAAAERARDAGLTVVQDRCMKVEHRRLSGGDA
jgi:predicted CoA-binding protein